jgi:hypothetical protein
MYKVLETLFAYDSKNNIKKWEVQIEGQTDCATIIVLHSILLGKVQMDENIITEGKNIGKSNETTAWGQAVSEAEAKWKHKKREGYKSFKDLDLDSKDYDVAAASVIEDALRSKLPKNNTDLDGNLKPMKAQPYFKDNGDVKISFPCYGQPKLNGIRCVGRLEVVKQGEGMFEEEIETATLRSKEGLLYNVPKHIIDELNQNKHIFKEQGLDLVFDGELYIHNEILSEIRSAATKYNKKTPLVKFCIFDLPIENCAQKHRTAMLNTLSMTSRLNTIKFVKTEIVETNEQAQQLTDKWIKEGYEGGIFRDKNADYAFGKRPQTMVKLKRSITAEFEVVNVIGEDKRPDFALFVCKNDITNDTFNVTPEGTFETKKQYLLDRDKLIGKKLTVRYFERTINKLPFHGVGEAIRDYE